MIAAAAQVAAWLVAARRAVVFTGAGISTESGVPDFRSPGGIWATSTPVDYYEFLAEEDARLEYWRQKAVVHHDFERCAPNIGHRLIAAWQQRGLVKHVITQNIDEFHQLAGSTEVIELHGTSRKVACLACGARYDAAPLVAAYEASLAIPPCTGCGSTLMKHATISFGQALDGDVLRRAIEASREADVFLALGSSLVVHPAAALPEVARESGAKLVIVNRDETPCDAIADLVLHAPLGETLQAIDAAVIRLGDAALSAPAE